MLRRIAWYLEVCFIILVACLYMAFDALRMALRRFQTYLQIRRFRRKYR